MAFGLILLVAAQVNAGQKATIEEAIAEHKSNDGCVCISSNFGCENIKGKIKMVQKGWCNTRCCNEPAKGEKRECRCMNISECPDEYPNEQGDCINMVECCPSKAQKKKKTEL
ncbi:uncharacterized protein LOC123539221 isoform X2 [Mercenaria mercenaria]|uniref:uncharacterized protein LOC123539221 isoform X2 n=1 Tax=Mercenaria mercenaria TaxID=6596 RepID=UPI00234ED341|nr:uncharacterized protein LOC123539221 isoform X2 [Mercenaria mercenaria]